MYRRQARAGWPKTKQGSRGQKKKGESEKVERGGERENGIDREKVEGEE